MNVLYTLSHPKATYTLVSSSTETSQRTRLKKKMSMTRKGTTESFSLASNTFMPFKLMNLIFYYKVHTKIKLLKRKTGILSSKNSTKGKDRGRVQTSLILMLYSCSCSCASRLLQAPRHTTQDEP